MKNSQKGLAINIRQCDYLTIVEFKGNLKCRTLIDLWDLLTDMLLPRCGAVLFDLSCARGLKADAVNLLTTFSQFIAAELTGVSIVGASTESCDILDIVGEEFEPLAA